MAQGAPGDNIYCIGSVGLSQDRPGRNGPNWFLNWSFLKLTVRSAMFTILFISKSDENPEDANSWVCSAVLCKQVE